MFLFVDGGQPEFAFRMRFQYEYNNFTMTLVNFLSCFSDHVITAGCMLGGFFLIRKVIRVAKEAGQVELTKYLKKVIKFLLTILISILVGIVS